MVVNSGTSFFVKYIFLFEKCKTVVDSIESLMKHTTLHMLENNYIFLVDSAFYKTFLVQIYQRRQ